MVSIIFYDCVLKHANISVIAWMESLKTHNTKNPLHILHTFYYLQHAGVQLTVSSLLVLHLLLFFYHYKNFMNSKYWLRFNCFIITNFPNSNHLVSFRIKLVLLKLWRLFWNMNEKKLYRPLSGTCSCNLLWFWFILRCALEKRWNWKLMFVNILHIYALWKLLRFSGSSSQSFLKCPSEQYVFLMVEAFFANTAKIV